LFAVTSFGPALHFLEANSGPKFAWPGSGGAEQRGQAVCRRPPSISTSSPRAARCCWVAGDPDRRPFYRLSVRRAFMSLVGVGGCSSGGTILTVVVVLALGLRDEFLRADSHPRPGNSRRPAGSSPSSPRRSAGSGVAGDRVGHLRETPCSGCCRPPPRPRPGSAPTWLAAANTSGGVLGKMISPQNLAIAAAVVGIEGRESELFRKVVRVEFWPCC